jgi:hypothetical protein
MKFSYAGNSTDTSHFCVYNTLNIFKEIRWWLYYTTPLSGMEWVSYLHCHCYDNLKSHEHIIKLHLTLSLFSIHSYTYDVGKIFYIKTAL